MIVFDYLIQGIGIALDIPDDRMFLTDLASVYTAKLDGPEKRPLLGSQGNPSGIAFAEMPHKKLKTSNGRNQHVV